MEQYETPPIHTPTLHTDLHSSDLQPVTDVSL